MTHQSDTPRLSPADADALDSLVEAGFDPAGVPPFLRARAEHVAQILGLLEPAGAIPANPARSPSMALEPAATLSPADAAALDALVQSGWSASDLPVQHRRRAGLIRSVLSSLDAGAVATDPADADTLIDATLARVERSRRVVDPADRRPRRRFLPRPTDLVSAAAILLIGSVILWPMLAGIRRQNLRVADAAHMANAGLGFAMYANDHSGRLPEDEATRAGRTPGVVWWNVGDPGQSHSANLFALVRTGYASLEDLASPANPQAPIRMDLSRRTDWRSPEEVSYSYQLLGPGLVRWSTPSRQVVLTDRSPIIQLARAGIPVDPMMNSFLHRGLGQQVLFNDRSVRWLDSPVTEWGDNIWLPRQLERRLRATLRGVELPDGRDDAFVGP